MISKMFKLKSEQIAQRRPVLMFNGGNLGGRGGTEPTQNHVVREEGWRPSFGHSTSVKVWLRCNLSCSDWHVHNGEREHDVSPKTESFVRDVEILSKAGWEETG